METRKAVFQAFEGDESPEIPAAILAGGAWMMHNSGNFFVNYIGNPKEYATLLAKYADIIGSDIVYVGSGFNNFHVAALGGKIKIRGTGVPDLDSPIMRTPDDLDRLDISSIDTDKVISTIREATKLSIDAMGSKYVITTTTWAPFTLAGQLMGVENFMRDIYKNPSFAKTVAKFATEFIKHFYEPMVDSGLDSVLLADPTASGDLISKKHFMEFSLPYLKNITKFLKKNNVYTQLHICGNTSDRFEEMADSGAECISLDHKIDLSDAKKRIGGRVCLAGNVDPVGTISEGTPRQIELSAKKCIAHAGYRGGFVLMPGCDIPPTTPLENIHIFLKSAKNRNTIQ